MSDNWAQLNGGRYLADLFQKDSIQAAFQRKIISAINKLGATLGANPVGNVEPPPPVNTVNINTSGEYMHVSLSQNAPVKKGISYFVEVANDPNFAQPIVHHLGPSRTMLPIQLPTMDNNGNTHKYYVRAYCQYPGSKPSKITTFGGPLNPASITMAGATKLNLLPSTGSGTSSTTGQQGGTGFGAVRIQTPVSGSKQSSANAVSVQLNVTTPGTSATTSPSTIAFDSSTGVNVSTPNSTYNFPHVCSGQNLVLIVSAYLVDTAGGSPGSITGVTYNGIALTKAVGATMNSLVSNNNYDVEIWYLLNPPTGSNTVSVTVVGAGATWGADLNAASFTNVSAQDAIGSNSSANNSSGNPTANITTTKANELIVGMAAGDNTISYSFFTSNTEPFAGYKILTTGAGTYMPGYTMAAGPWVLAVASFTATGS